MQFSINNSHLKTVPSERRMFSGSYEACGSIIPVSYVQQAQNARKSRENQIRTFLEHVSNVEISCAGLDDEASTYVHVYFIHCSSI